MGRKTSRKNIQPGSSQLRGRLLLEGFYLLPLVFAVAAVPLIVYLKVIPLEGVVMEIWPGEVNYDFFAYWKSAWLVAAAGAALLAFGALSLGNRNERTGKGTARGISRQAGKRAAKKSRPKEPAARPHSFKEAGPGQDTLNRPGKIFAVLLGVYALFVILSTLFAEHRQVALAGFADRYEGMWVLLAYLLLCFLSMHMIQTERHLKIILTALFCSAALAGTLGIFQYMGHDLFQTDFGRALIIPSAYRELAEQLAFRFGPRTMYSTMYNINYVGSYMAMLFILSFTFFLLLEGKERRYRLPVKIALGLFSILMLANLLGSNSRTGYFAAAAALTLLFLLLHRVLHRMAPYLLGVGLFFGLVFAGANYLSQGQPAEEVERLLADLRELLAREEESVALRERVMDIQMGQNEVTLVPPGDMPPLTLGLQAGELFFLDTGGNNLEYRMDLENGGITFRLLEEAYENSYRVTFCEERILTVRAGHFRPQFVFLEEEIHALDYRGHLTRIEPVESWGFQGLTGFGTHRGYIWSRSLPLLKETAILGFGPDTYPIYFPQHDYLGRINFFDRGETVDKPHNMYLQVAINTGGPSLMAMLALFGLYFVSSLKLYFGRRDFSHFYAVAGTGIFAACFAYTVAGLANDSLVSVAPVFWILLGLGIQCNTALQRKV